MATMMFAQRFTGYFNVRDKMIMTTGIVIVIADTNHNVSGDIASRHLVASPTLKSPL
jgi:hypothetical protein